MIHDKNVDFLLPCNIPRALYANLSPLLFLWPVSELRGALVPPAPLYLRCCIMYNLNRLVMRLQVYITLISTRKTSSYTNNPVFAKWKLYKRMGSNNKFEGLHFQAAQLTLENYLSRDLSCNFFLYLFTKYRKLIFSRSMAEPFSNLLRSKEAVSENVRMLTQKVVEKIGHNTYIKTKLDSYENRYILKTNLSKFMILNYQPPLASLTI